MSFTENKVLVLKMLWMEFEPINLPDLINELWKGLKQKICLLFSFYRFALIYTG